MVMSHVKTSTLQDSNIDTAYDDTMLKVDIISAKVVLYVNMKYDTFFAQTLDITHETFMLIMLLLKPMMSVNCSRYMYAP